MWQVLQSVRVNNKNRPNNGSKQVQNLAYLMSFSKEHIRKSSTASNSLTQVHFTAFIAFYLCIFLIEATLQDHWG